jgi:8-oxo-dGTP pyrophosphatase MutT (NUDIX family)
MVSDPLVPRPAATVMVVRDAPGGFELLMLRRNLNSDFVGGAYVFPGGGVDAADATSTAEHRVDGLSDATASARLGLASGGLAYYVACLRELFEEAGLLVARDQSEQLVRLEGDETIRRFAAHRRAVNAGDVRFLDVVSEEHLRLDLHALEYVAHWVTPTGQTRRYDTRFFVALAPEAQRAAHDDNETVADEWIRPVDALARHRDGEFQLLPPTIRNLEAISDLANTTAVMTYARQLTSIPRIEPRIVERDGRMAILFPGDDGFDLED